MKITPPEKKETELLESTDKPCVALIIPGGIGTGHNNIGVPVLERIVRLLSVDFSLTVFQLYKVDKNYPINGFKLIAIHSSNPMVRSLKFFRAFSKAHRQQSFKAIHGFWAVPCGFLAVLAGKLFGIRSIVSVLGGDAISLPEINYGQLRNPLYAMLTRWTIQKADDANALTHYLVENLKKASIVRQDVNIIPWGINTSLFAFKEKSISAPVRFLHIANLHPVKDQDTLLRAFKIIQENISSHLTIIGEGMSDETIRSLIMQLDLQHSVTLLGLVPYETLPNYYHNADILLHTSRSEGQSEVVTEAMSCGVLVCGTNVGLLYDLPACCVSVSVGDYRTLAMEALQLIKSPERQTAIRNFAHLWTKSHSLEWTVKKIKECYRI